jgi:hypothetical protein
MSWGLQTWLRVAGWASLVPWLVALFLTCYAIPPDEIRTSDWAPVAHLQGWDLLLCGWIGPVDGSLAWYANPCWLWNTILMMRGRPPNPFAAVGGLVLAATALLPFHSGILDDHGANGPFCPLAGAYLWASALIPAAVMAALAHLAVVRSVDRAA